MNFKKIIILKVILFVTLHTNAQVPTPANINISSALTNYASATYTRASIKIKLTNGFKYGQVSGGATNLLNLNISSLPNYVNSAYNNVNSPLSNCYSGIDESKSVGEISGSLDISGTGGAIYTIPIYASPGTNGVAPNLSVYYNSQTASGELGHSWHLGGISSISRTGKIPINDGTISGINLSLNDYFALDGNKLMSSSGIYGSNGATYVTENETFSQIISNGQTVGGGGPQWFQVTDKKGNVYEYGKSNNSVFTGISNNTALTWKINKVTDEFGNYMNFYYSNIDGENVIDKIEYTGNAGASLRPYNTIEFGYIPLAEKNKYYINGVEFRTSLLLKTIVSKAEGLQGRRYEFNYDWNQYKTVLTSVQMADAKGDEVNPTFFCWDDLNGFASYKAPQQGNLFSSQSDYTNLNLAVPADIDGNGFTDFVCTYTNNFASPTTGGPRVRVLRNNFVGFYGGSNTTIPYTKIYDDDQAYYQIPDWSNSPGNVLGTYVIDDNLDNAQDVYLIVKPRVNSNSYSIDKLAYNAGSNGVLLTSVGTFNNLTSAINVNASPSQFFFDIGDYTGDGVNDQLRIDPQNIFITSTQGNLSFPLSSNTQVVRPFELDGDGIPEYITMERVGGNTTKVQIKVFKLTIGVNSLTLNQITSLLLNLNTSSSTTNRNLLDHISLGDYNGDGKMDILALDDEVRKFHIHYSDGITFKPAIIFSTLFENAVASAIATFKTRPIDLNKDGKCDLIITTDENTAGQGTPSYFTFYYLGDNSFVQGPSYTGNYNFTNVDYIQYKILNADRQGQVTDYREEKKSMSVLTGVGIKADFNGDGYFDIYSINDPTNDRVITNNATGFSDLSIQSIRTGLHTKIDIGYTNILTELYLGNGAQKEETYRNSQEYFGPGAPAQTVFSTPLHKYKPDIFCVHFIDVSNGYNWQFKNRTKYIYENAILHSKGRGILGFEKVYTFDAITKVGTIKTSDFSNSLSIPLNYVVNSLKFFSGTSPLKQVPTYFPNLNNLISTQEINFNIVNQTAGNKVIQLSSTQSINYLLSTKSNMVVTYDMSSAGNVQTKTSTDLNWSNIAIRTVIDNYSYVNNHGNFKLDTKSSTSTQQGQIPYSRSIQYTYDTQGRLSKSQEDPTLGNRSLVTDYTSYNAFGLVTQKSTSAGDVTARNIQMDYDNKGRFITRSTDALGNLQQFVYEPVYGNIIAKTDITGHLTSMQYDGLGRIRKTLLPSGVLNKVTYAWDNPSSSYYTYNKATSLRLGIYSKLIETESQPYIKEYYAPSALLRTETSSFNGVIVTDNKYNLGFGSINPNLEDGVLLEGTELHYDNQASYLVTQFVYDYSYFRLQSENVYKWSGGSYTSKNIYKTYSYNTPSGTSVGSYNQAYRLVTDQSGRSVNIVKNAAAQTVSVTNSDPSTYLITAYEYLSNGSPITLKLIDGSNIITTNFEYNSLGQQTLVTDPASGTYKYGYNTIGEMTTTIDPNNLTWTTNYDLLGRATSKSGASGTTYYQYVTASNGKTQVEKIIGPNVTTEFKYDNLNNLTETKETTGSKIFKTNYEVDKYGRVIKQTYPSTYVVKTEYDQYGNLSRLTDANNTALWQLNNQDAFGNITSYSSGNGITTNITNTDIHYLSEIDYVGLQKQEYTFNSLTGNLTGRKLTRYVPTNPTLLQETFDYDGTDRLKNSKQVNPVNTSQILQYNSLNYNNIGNITKKDDAASTYQYQNTNNPYLITGLQNIVNNNSLSSLSIAYNDINKVSQIINPTTNKKYDFSYGNNNERIRMVYSLNSNNQYTRYYSENYDLQESNSAIKEWSYVFAPTGLCGVYYNNNGSKQLLYTVIDHLGSPLAITNGSGSLLEEYSFDSWGRRRDPSNWLYANVPAPSHLIRGYTMHEHLDEETLINMNGRVYDPVLGRFIQPDRYIIQPDNLQNFNRFAYCLNNPLKYTDPTGNFAVEAAIVAFLVVGVIHALGFNYNVKSKHFNMYPSQSFPIGVSVAASVLVAPIALESGIIGANTISGIEGSMAGSYAANIASGGESGYSVSFGAASYDFVNNEAGYLGKKGNTTLQNFGYFIGATANAQDIVAGFNGGNVDVLARKKLAGHSQGEMQGTGDFISVGPSKSDGSIINYENDLKWEMQFAKRQLQGDPIGGENVKYIDADDIAKGKVVTNTVYNVNKTVFSKLADNLNCDRTLLNTGKFTYGAGYGCVNYMSRELLYSGVFNFNAFLPITAPLLLNLELGIRQMAISQSPYVYKAGR